MTDRECFEQDVFAEVQGAIAAALPKLHDRGLNVGPLEFSRAGEGEHYESELRLYAYRGKQLCDALEVHACRGGQPAATAEELREWFRSQLDSLG